MRRPGVLALSICWAAVLWLCAPVARAAGDDAAAVVILPFSTADDDLAIYGKPVADAVAHGLKGRAGLTALAAGVEGELPPRGDLIVELRMTRARRKLIQLEALVRDPEAGTLVASVAASPVKLANIDKAAADLSERLGPPLDEAARARRLRKQQEADAKQAEALAARPPDPVPHTPGDPAPAPAPGDPDPAPAPPADTRPIILLYHADGTVAGGSVPVQEIASAAVAGLVAQLGYRGAFSSGFGVVASRIAAQDARDASAKATVMVHVDGIDFTWKGVLLARGHVRIAVVSAAGRRLLDRTVHTDTVVGSRGDRHDALVRFVMRQAIEIVGRDVARVLK